MQEVPLSAAYACASLGHRTLPVEPSRKRMKPRRLRLRGFRYVNENAVSINQ